MKKIIAVLIAISTCGVLADTGCYIKHRTVINSMILKTMCVAPANLFSKGKGIIEFTSDYGETEILKTNYSVCKTAEDASISNTPVLLNIKCRKNSEVISSVTLKEGE